ncbi:MAG: pentapeptide repeat-containing protein [Alphaproteobacteria bacterium]|nr:pentapeptide repeat-containing protein [Alphaproteobacteria bacterium]
MSDNNEIDNIRSKIKQEQKTYDENLQKEFSEVVSWSKVYQPVSLINDQQGEKNVSFIGKNLEGGKFSKENLKGANFSVANLTGVDFSGADLRGVDFSGANLTGANLEGADLSGAVLSGAVLKNVNFTKAKLNGIKLVGADLENVILLDIEIDALGIEELQELIEYLAKYYPHKLNLAKMNLSLLDFTKIDLSRVNLAGVDFTGVNFTGVSITGLDLSQCKITPEQIAQALGRVPSAEELAKILAPKKKKKGKDGLEDIALMFQDGKDYLIWDFTKDKGISIDTLMKVGKKVFSNGKKPQEKIEDNKKNDVNDDEKAKSHNEELRKIIEERKQKELAARRAMKENVVNEPPKKTNNNIKNKQIIPNKNFDRGR